MTKINGVEFNKKDAAETIMRSFFFGDTPQGSDYWLDMVERLGEDYPLGSAEEKDFEARCDATGLSGEELFPQIVEPHLSEKEFEE